MSGNSQERRRERRLADRVLAQVPSKYRWDLGSVGVSMSLRFAAGDISQAFYWIGALGFYLAIWSLARHLWSEQKLLGAFPKLRKGLVSSFVGITLSLWTVNIFWPAPLETMVIATLGNYPAGTSLAGIAWDSTMDEDGRLNLKNPTDNNYKDLNLYVLSDVWIVNAVKLSGIDDIRTAMYDPEKLQIRGTWLSGTDDKGNPVNVPGPSQPLNLGHPTGVQIIGDVFHSKGDLEILLVMIAFNQAHGLHLPDKMFSQKRMPKFVTVRGTYKVLGRTREIDRKINIEAIQ